VFILRIKKSNWLRFHSVYENILPYRKENYTRYCEVLLLE
ncbi:MAG: hypothetical protein ACI9DJ_001730, partial [Algoriphagus sp.]